MSWSTSTRRQRLPSDWPKLRKKVLKRDRGLCQLQGPRCETLATEVDHKVHGDDHSLSNLQAACRECHKTKSSSEGGEALAKQRREIEARFKIHEPHPGLIQ